MAEIEEQPGHDGAGMAQPQYVLYDRTVKRRPLQAVINALRVLAPHLSDFKTHIFIIFVLTVLAVIPLLAVPWVIGLVIDLLASSSGYSSDEKIRCLALLIVVLFTVEIINFTVSYLKQYYSTAAGQVFAFRLRLRLHRKLVDAKLGGVREFAPAQLSCRAFDDAGLLENMFFSAAGGLGALLLAPLSFIAITCVLFVINARLAFLTLIPIPVLAVTAVFFTRHFRRLAPAVKQSSADTESLFMRNINNLKIIKLSCTGDAEQEKFKQQHRIMVLNKLELENYLARFYPLINLIAFAGVLAVAMTGGLNSIYGGLSTGELVSFIAYLSFYYIPLSEMSRANFVLQNLAASVERVNEILAIEDEPGSIDIILPSLSGDISVTGLDFAYKPGTDVLKGVSFEIKRGQKVLLSGPNGRGKTTLLNLITRLVEPPRKRIFADSRDILDLPVMHIRRNIAFLPQENILFNDTVLNNILYGNAVASPDDVRRICVLTGLDGVIARIPGGLSAMVGEGGFTLSHGEQRRICLARTLLKSAPVILLDEPVAGVDGGETILGNILSAFPDASIIITAHTVPAVIKGFDNIIEL